ncbi:hypothetical protein BJF81_16115 [Ornithinimicrobium sp. CNJ-824]|nr:hypothetical protein BJF81_16115 [Ornithinimicrobium sp. CNJ-824]
MLREQGCQVAERTYRAWRQPARPVAERTISDALVMDTVRDLAWTTDGRGRRPSEPRRALRAAEDDRPGPADGAAGFRGQRGPGDTCHGKEMSAHAQFKV